PHHPCPNPAPVHALRTPSFSQNLDSLLRPHFRKPSENHVFRLPLRKTSDYCEDTVCTALIGRRYIWIQNLTSAIDGVPTCGIAFVQGFLKSTPRRVSRPGQKSNRTQR